MNDSDSLILSVNKLKFYIDHNLTQDLSLKSLSNTFHYNEQYMSRRFKETMHISLQQYILFSRVDLAKKYLLKGFSPAKACEASGFRDYANFSKLFKKYTGVTPKEYQLQMLWQKRKPLV